MNRGSPVIHPSCDQLVNEFLQELQEDFDTVGWCWLDRRVQRTLAFQEIPGQGYRSAVRRGVRELVYGGVSMVLHKYGWSILYGQSGRPWDVPTASRTPGSLPVELTIDFLKAVAKGGREHVRHFHLARTMLLRTVSMLERDLLPQSPIVHATAIELQTQGSQIAGVPQPAGLLIAAIAPWVRHSQV